MKRLLLAVAVLCCSGCALFTPYAEWPNGSPMFPGALKIENDRLKDPNYRPTTLELIQRRAACIGPAAPGGCPTS